MSTAEDGAMVSFEGGGVGTELWGMTQANFLVHLPRRHSKEVAIMLNDAAAVALATELGVDNTSAFRSEAAERVGRYIVERRAKSGHHLDSAITVSAADLANEPGLLESLKLAPA